MQQAQPEEGFARLASLLQDAFLLADEAGTVRAANPAALRTLGAARRDELEGRSLHELCAPGEDVAAVIRQACRTRNFVPSVLVFLTAFGEKKPLRVDGALFRSRQGQEPAQVAFRLLAKQHASMEFLALRQKIQELSREIVARRRVEEQLARTSARYRVTLESIGDAVIATDRKGHVTFMNHVAEQLTGWSAAEAEGRHLDEVFRIVNDATRQPVESPVTKVLRLGTIVGLANHTLLLRRDGSELPIDDSGAPIRDSEGRIDGVVLVFRDLSERYALERELVAKTVRLEEEDRRKNEFLSMLAHELRNPLAPLRTGVEIIKRNDRLPPPIGKTADIMERQVVHMSRLIDDLLDVSRLTKGKVEVRLSPLPIRTVVEEAEEMMRPLYEHRGIKLDVSDAPDVELNGDRTRLVQVLGNLLSNAAKFSPSGSVVSLRAEPRGDMVAISVADAGVGIAAESLSKIFELFYQEDQGLGREQGGLGLGLTISLAIVELHGGRIEAHSAGPGKGCTFTVLLPALMPGKAEGPTPRYVTRC